MAVIEKIKKFVKDITPPSGEQKAKIEEKQMKVEEMKEHKMKKGGMCKGYAKGGGIEVRGKTKGKII